MTSNQNAFEKNTVKDGYILIYNRHLVLLDFTLDAILIDLNARTSRHADIRLAKLNALRNTQTDVERLDESLIEKRINQLIVFSEGFKYDNK